MISAVRIDIYWGERAFGNVVNVLYDNKLRSFARGREWKKLFLVGKLLGIYKISCSKVDILAETL